MAKVKNVEEVNNKKNRATPARKQSEGAVSAPKKSKRLILPIILLTLIIIGISIGVFTTPVFNINSIEAPNGINVNGGALISAISNVKGINTFKLNKKKLEAVVENHPYVKSAKINRVLPDKLSITYTERKPYALVKYLESYVVMDKFGYVLEIKKENDLEDLTIIYGINADEYVEGKMLEGAAKVKYENVVYLLETVVQVGFEYAISEINYRDTNDLMISIKDKAIEVEYGEVERSILSEKIIYLNSTLKSLNDKKGTINMSSEDYMKKGIIFKERY